VSPTPAQQILKQYWGYDAFRPLQAEIIEAIVAGKDTLALLPTGGGKSICYQVPALMQEGVCLVISPLIALMQDQVARLQELDVPAACIYSGMNYREVRLTMENAMNDAYKLLYVSPERLQTDLFNDYLSELDISFIAVDEAHCVSQWGHDFRPDYLKINSVREYFANVPLLALTATATGEVAEDITRHLGMKQPQVYRQSFARKNIFYTVSYTENKTREVLDRAGKGCTIVYTRSRKGAEVVGQYLQREGVSAAVYHAGMTADARAAAQQAWMRNEARTMVATTAFGMGIDKPDVRLVMHYDAPEHIEAWYQEAGRAGRDGQPSAALTLYNQPDIDRLLQSTALQYPPEAYLRQVYQAVAEYLQVPIGVEPQKYFSFDAAEFCRRFGLELRPALHALKLLEREGLWTLTESVYRPATVQFQVGRQVVDGLAASHPGLGYVATGLLRMYNTIFFYPTQVRETAVARQLKMDKEKVAEALELLDRMEIISYNKPGEGAQLLFHHCRADSRHLLLDLNRIHFLRKRHEARTEAMIRFLRNTERCRERIVLEYFGETPTADCGHCDVCRDRAAKPLSRAMLKAQLLAAIEAGPSTADELLKPYTGPHRDQALAVLRQMLDDGEIAVKGQFLVLSR